MIHPYETDNEKTDRLIREVRELKEEIAHLSQRVKVLEDERNESRKNAVEFGKAIGLI